MNKTIKEQLDKMENHLNEALDNDLFNDPEFDMDEFQSKVCSFERELNEILEFNREHLQFPELEKICSVQKKIKQVRMSMNSMIQSMKEASCSQMVRMRKRMISPSKYRQVWKIDLI